MNKKTTGLVLALGAAALTTAAIPATAADKGEQLFRRYCFICHDTAPGKNKIGPSLAGIYGRTAGKEDGFPYSTAMRSAGITWDEKSLDAYLNDPRGKVPGNKMLFAGVKNAEERHAIIEYLEQLKS
jgi:cytochrome c